MECSKIKNLEKEMYESLSFKTRLFSTASRWDHGDGKRQSDGWLRKQVSDVPDES